MRKLIGIFIVSLLISTTILSIASSEEKNDNRIISNEAYVDDRGCDSISLISRKVTNNIDPPSLTIESVPDYFNWRDFGWQDWTTYAKNQYYPNYCDCCWAFAAMGSLESVINIMEGSAIIDPDLSEQYALSCLPDAATNPGHGCNGGSSLDVIRLMIATTPEGNYHNGALLEECFPYQASDDIPCDNKCPDWVDKLVPIVDTDYLEIGLSPEDMIIAKSTIMEKGPVCTTMLVTQDFNNWESTHHDSDDYYPYHEASHTCHVLIIVGWKDDSSIEKGGYWICKNSLGTEKGYDGFFNIVYGSLNVGLEFQWIDYNPENYEWDNEPNPPTLTTITGKTNGGIRTEYEYTFNSVDPEGYNLRYYISWGDGDWEWTDFYPSGEDVTVKHTYNTKGDFSVVSLAMNTNGNIGPWGTLEISMPKNKLYTEYNPLFFRLIKWLPILEFLIQYPVNL